MIGKPNPRCQRCDLHETCQSVNIPGRWWRAPTRWMAGGKGTQLLMVIGKAPGREEDNEGSCFVGASGQILDDWLTALDPPPSADIWLCNTVRCRLISDDNPLSQSQVYGCRHYLAEELRHFTPQYDRVTILVLGADASQAFGKGAITKAIRSNGAPIPVMERITCYEPKKMRSHLKCPELNRRILVQGFKKVVVEHEIGTYPVFVTYHPAATLPDRSPEKIHAVMDHLQMLDDHLEDKPLVDIHIDQGVDPLPDPPPDLELMALDIETYGILKAFDQTVFHPMKSIEVDKVKITDLIQCIGIAYPKDGEVFSASYLWDTEHRSWVCRWLDTLIKNNGTLVFMNSLFDLSYLRMFPDMKNRLNSDLRVEDLVIFNQLDSDQRAERDLKSLQRLFHLKGGDAHQFKQYPHARDPELHHYVKEDAATTLYLRNRMLKTIDPAGNTPFARQWFSDLIWSTLHMFESGATYDPSKLWSIKLDNDKKITALRSQFKAEFGKPLAGPGSGSSIPTIVKNASLSINQDVPLTKKGRIKSDKMVLQSLLLDLPDGPHRRLVEIADEHRKLSQMNDHYGNKRLNMLLKGGRVYPSWYLAPSLFSENEDTVYGTKQGRISCSNPGLQTDPDPIVKCWCSRWQGGIIVRMDLKQIELVVSGLLSGDEKMLRGMSGDGDLHTALAIFINGPDVVNRSDFKTIRHAAKQANFLIIYRGNAKILQQTLLKRQGMRMPINDCRRLIKETKRAYSGLWSFQDGLIYEATRRGYMADPILGYRRWLTTSRSINRGILESTICNFPIQRIAACTTLDLQHIVVKTLEERGLQSRLFFNGFDALVVDCPKHEAPQVTEIMRSSLTQSQYWRKIEHATRPWPLKAEFETTPPTPEE